MTKKLKRFIAYNKENMDNLNENLDFIELRGIVKYNPERPGLKSQAACCIIEIDQGIVDFYRSLLNSHYKTDLLKPSWNAHISVIQGSIDVNSNEYKAFWLKYDNQEVVFRYKPLIRYSGDTLPVENGDNGWFWFIDVECEMIKKIREDFGLPFNKAHFTIAKKKR